MFLVRSGLVPVGHRFGVLARPLITSHRPDGACPHRTPLWCPNVGRSFYAEGKSELGYDF